MVADEGSEERHFVRRPYSKYLSFLIDLVDVPITWFRETIVLPNRKEYYWYHQKIRRVPTVDQCYTDDAICIYEANVQFNRDKKVDKYILDILRKRYESCISDYLYDKQECNDIKKAWELGTTNYFIKYGDLGIKKDAISCLIKQKNRMAFERRYGPVGSGRNPPQEEIPKKHKTC